MRDELRLKEPPFVSVIIVHYNGKCLLRDCLDSVIESEYPDNRREILVVDNGSCDGSPEYIRKRYPGVRLLKNEINNYCRANNLGIRASQGEYVALLNNDTKVDKDWLAELVDLMSTVGQAGAVGSKVLFLDGKIQSAGHVQLPNYYWGDRGFLEEDAGQYSAAEEVVSVSNASALYKKEALIKAGLFDEDFGMYMEDLDMNFRLRACGYRIFFAPRSVVRHKLHGSQATDTLRRDLILKNRLRFLAKHFPERLPEHLCGFGEVLHLNDEEFQKILDFFFLDLAKYWSHNEGLNFKMKESLAALRDYRARSIRTDKAGLYKPDIATRILRKIRGGW